MITTFTHPTNSDYVVRLEANEHGYDYYSSNIHTEPFQVNVISPETGNALIEFFRKEGFIEETDIIYDDEADAAELAEHKTSLLDERYDDSFDWDQVDEDYQDPFVTSWKKFINKITKS